MAVTITVSDIQKARDYMPVENKVALASLMAKLCVRVRENDTMQTDRPLPPMRVEDRLRRLQCLNGVLCGFYLGGEFETEKLRYKDADGNTQERDIDFCMSVGALDAWLSGHPMDQFERLKKEKMVANKVYDLLYDFKAFELLLNAAIREELEMANDPALRMSMMLAVQTTPEELQKTLELFEEMQGRKKAGGEAYA